MSRSIGWIRLALTFWLLGCAGALPVCAEPAFAVRTGYRCSQCHMNRTGGGLRTSFGSIYSQTILPRRLRAVWPSRSIVGVIPTIQSHSVPYVGTSRRVTLPSGASLSS